MHTNPYALHERNNDWFDFTPLLYAAVVSDFFIFEWLIDQSANSQEKDINEANAFDLAIFRHENTVTNQRAKIDYLLKLGAKFEHDIFELIYQGNNKELVAKHALNADVFKVQDKANHNVFHYAAALGLRELLIWCHENLQFPLYSA